MSRNGYLYGMQKEQTAMLDMARIDRENRRAMQDKTKSLIFEQPCHAAIDEYGGLMECLETNGADSKDCEHLANGQHWQTCVHGGLFDRRG
jgi:hypothetical protein